MERIEAMRMRLTGLALVLAVPFVANVAIAAADEPVAVVEEVRGQPGVEFMDYLSAGHVVRLVPGEALVLGYATSCWRETIVGGIVIVGSEQSEVRGGKVDRVKVACDAGKIRLLRQQSAMRPAGTSFRDERPNGHAFAPEEPRLTLFGSSPLVEIRAGHTLLIERIDKPGERHEIKSAQLVRGSFYDFAAENRTLQPGGIYRARAERRQVVFRIDPSAQPGRTPIVGRLLPFPPYPRWQP
jgi:hypothetical protein